MISRLPRLASAAAFLGALAVAAFLRLDGLGVPSLWLDEILHQQLTTRYAALPWWRWLGRLHEEHAGLYYLTQWVTRLFGVSEAAARSAAALFGIATVAVASAIARATRGGAVAAAATAILLATSPLHVYFSREARSYALLALLTAALTLVLLRGRSLVAVVLVLLALLYTSAVAATVILAALAIAALTWRRGNPACPPGRPPAPERDRQDCLSSTWLVVACVVVLALFRVVYTSGPVENANWPGFPELNAQFLATLVRTFTVSALGTAVAGRTAAAMCLFALIGAAALARDNRRHAIVIAGMTLFPLVISLAALKTLDHFFAIRYVMASVVGFTVLAGVGIATCAAFLHRHVAAPAAIAIAVLMAVQMWPTARHEPFQKLDWRAVAETIAAHAKPNDIVIAAESWSDVSLRHYLEQHPKPPQIALVPQVVLAEMLRNGRPGAFIVSAGYEDSPMRRWMCAFPMIAASPLENLRVHYASAGSDFLVERGGLPELRAYNAALGARGFTLSMTAGDERFLGEGWALPEEGVFRWAVGRRATLRVPRFRLRDAIVRFRVLPLEHPSLAPQAMRASVGGYAEEITLASGWSEPAIEIPARFWSDDWTTITLDFARATAPAALDPRAHDTRPLAASFDWIAVDDDGAPPSRERPMPLATIPRSATGAVINKHTLWRGGETRFSTPHLRREEVFPLLGRLGFDPLTGWLQLEAGELQLEELAESLAYGQDCVDGDSFLRQAFAVILERAPNEGDLRDLNMRMRNGLSRPEVVRRIVRSEEFAMRYTK